MEEGRLLSSRWNIRQHESESKADYLYHSGPLHDNVSLFQLAGLLSDKTRLASDSMWQKQLGWSEEATRCSHEVHLTSTVQKVQSSQQSWKHNKLMLYGLWKKAGLAAISRLDEGKMETKKNFPALVSSRHRLQSNLELLFVETNFPLSAHLHSSRILNHFKGHYAHKIFSLSAASRCWIDLINK